MNSSQKSGNDDVIFLVLKPIAQQHYICKEQAVLGNVIIFIIDSLSLSGASLEWVPWVPRNPRNFGIQCSGTH